MPPLNARRVAAAAKRAADATGRTASHARLEELPNALRLAAPRDVPVDLGNARRAAETILADAVRREADARAAQEAAVEALRWLGGYAASWDDVGALVGMSGQGAHRRYRHVMDPPRELTITDALEGSSSC